MPYAHGTTTTIAESKQEIGRILTRYKAGVPIFHEEETVHHLQFSIGKRPILINLPVPPPLGPASKYYNNAERAKHVALRAKRDKEVQRRYRALALVLKAKLEAVESGIATVEQEFLSDLLLPNGQRVGDAVGEQLVRVYEQHAGVIALPAPR